MALATTRYFSEQVLRKRPYIRRGWCERIVRDPLRPETQPDGRIRHWGHVPELGGRVLRVITLADGVTLHNAFSDRSFKEIAASRRSQLQGVRLVRLFYYPETDSLYVEFQDRPSVETREIGPDMRLDLDEAGRPVGLDVDHASECFDLSIVEAKGLPHVAVERRAPEPRRGPPSASSQRKSRARSV